VNGKLHENYEVSGPCPFSFNQRYVLGISNVFVVRVDGVVANTDICGT
jgi:hypothetical protein